MTSTVGNLSISGSLNIKALYNSAQSAANQGTFALESGSVDVGGSVAFTTVPFFGPTLTMATGAQSGTLVLSNAVPFTFTGGGSSTFTPNGSDATVIYCGSAQGVDAATYQNLVLSGSGTKTNAGVTVNGILSRQGTAKVSAVPTYGASATLEYAGSSAQTSGPELPATIPNLIINNSNDVTLTNSPTVTGVLTLSNGNLVTGTNQLIIATNGSVIGGGTGSFINGKLQKNFSAGTQSFVFPVGDTVSYAPVSLTDLSVLAAGGVKILTTNGNHPQIATSGISSTQNVNRYWTLAQSGGSFGSYSATFNYPGTDVDAGAVAAQFAVGQWTGVWSSSTVSGTPTTNATSIAGQAGFGDFVIGDPTTMEIVWSGGAGADKSWSNGSNWMGGLSPRAIDDVFFYDTGGVATASNVNNTVDANFAGTVNSVTFGNTNNFHTTSISAGSTLNVLSNFTVGTETYSSATQKVVATITGPSGTLNINASNAIWNVRQGVAFGTSTPGTPSATLDLSGLGMFTVLCRGMDAGVESGTIRRVAGVMYLARTNVIYADGQTAGGTTYSGNPGIYVGHNTQSQNQSAMGSAIYLGITNAIFADYIVIGRGNQTNNLMTFNPGVIASQPTAYFRGFDGVSRVGVWTIGDNSASGPIASPSSGTNDFTGGQVDAMVGMMFVGRGAANNAPGASSPGIGTLTYNNGVFDISTLYIGYQNLSSNIYSSGIGTVNVNSTNATLLVNDLELGYATNTSIVTPSGTLNLFGATAKVNAMTAAGGTAILVLSNATLVLSNTAGSAANPLTSLACSNSVIQLQVAAGATNINVSSLTTGGSSNRIDILTLPTITSYPTQYTLIKYSGTISGAGNNFMLGSLPAANPAYQGYVSNITAKSAVVLVLTAPPAKLAVTSVNGGTSPAVAAPFNVVVQSQDTGGTPRNVTVDTTVTLSLGAGTGVLGGTLSGTIPAGTNFVTVSNITYDTAQSGVKITATCSGGANLTAGTSAAITVNPGSQTISFPSPGNQTYGVAPLTLTATASSGLTVGYSVLSGPASVAGNSLTVTGAGSVTIQASQPGNGNWNAAPSTNVTITIAQKSVTPIITVSDKMYDGTTNAAIVTRALTGVINSDIVALAGGTASFATKTVGTGKTVNAVGLSLTGTNAPNYVLASTSASTTASITNKPLTVSGVTVTNKTYDGTTNATLNFSGATLSGIVSNDAVSLNSSGGVGFFADKNMGTNKAVAISGLAISGTDSGNYTLIQPTEIGNIASATLFVSVLSTNRLYGASNPAFTATYSGFVSGENSNVLSGAPAFATPAGTNSTVAGSPYSLTVSQGTLSAMNYNFNFGEGNLSVNPAPLTVSADNQSRPYGATNPVLTASYSGFVNNESSSVLGGSPQLSTTADVSSPVGAYPITISQGTLSDSNYAFSFTNGTLTVVEVPPTVSGGISTNSSGNSQFVMTSGGLKPSSTYYLLASSNLVQWVTNASAQSSSAGTVSFTNVITLPSQYYRLYGP
jgi:hypothetical protein